LPIVNGEAAYLTRPGFEFEWRTSQDDFAGEFRPAQDKPVGSSNVGGINIQVGGSPSTYYYCQENRSAIEHQILNICAARLNLRSRADTVLNLQDISPLTNDKLPWVLRGVESQDCIGVFAVVRNEPHFQSSAAHCSYRRQLKRRRTDGDPTVRTERQAILSGSPMDVICRKWVKRFQSGNKNCEYDGETVDKENSGRRID
jgi:hypothetical protein